MSTAVTIHESARECPEEAALGLASLDSESSFVFEVKLPSRSDLSDCWLTLNVTAEDEAFALKAAAALAAKVGEASVSAASEEEETVGTLQEKSLVTFRICRSLDAALFHPTARATGATTWGERCRG